MRKNRLGLSLIEVMIAMGVLSVAALASASLLTSGQRGLRALNGGTEYMSDVSRLQLFFTSASPTACANALFSVDGRPLFLPQPAGSPTPTTLPMTAVSRIQMDGIVLASAYASGGASRFSSIMLQELFTSLRSRVDADPSDSDPTPNATVYVGQIVFQGQRIGDIIGGRNLPDFFVPISFTVRDPIPPEATGPVIACQMGVARPTLTGSTDQIEIERRTCVDAFGGVYDAGRIPRCVLRSLVIAEDHASAQAAIDALPSSLWPSPGPSPTLSPRRLPAGVFLGGQLFAQNFTASEGVTANRVMATDGITTASGSVSSFHGDVNINNAALSIMGTAQLNGYAICTENGVLCRPAPMPSPSGTPTSTPTPTPTPALAAATYTTPGTEFYTVPEGATGRLLIEVIGAGGSGGCGHERNGEGGKKGEYASREISVTGPAVFFVKVGRSTACNERENGGRNGITGESSSFVSAAVSVVALGGAGGRKNVPGDGNESCYPDRLAGFGEPGPIDSSGRRALVCGCNNAEQPGTEHSSGLPNQPGFREGCATDIAGAGGGGGADNRQGGRGGHGMVRVTPI